MLCTVWSATFWWQYMQRHCVLWQVVLVHFHDCEVVVESGMVVVMMNVGWIGSVSSHEAGLLTLVATPLLLGRPHLATAVRE